MVVLQPGEHYEGLEIKQNPVFGARAPRVRVSAAERFLTSALHAAELATRQGFAVTADTVHMMNAELPFGKLVELMGSDRFQRACVERGIVLASASGLTPQQLMAIRVYTDTSVPSGHADRLKIIGISDATWRGWLRQPRFAAEVSHLSEEAIRSTKDVALLRLAEAADAGQRWAIEMVLELTGRHDRRKENVDASAVLMAVFSILDEEVGDTAVLTRISDRIKQMLGAGAAPVLQITPSLQDLREEPKKEESL